MSGADPAGHRPLPGRAIRTFTKEDMMLTKRIIAAGLAVALGVLAACTEDPAINAATGGLAGAALGSQVGGGSGRVAATLGGAAIGTAIGANVGTNRTCIYRDASTGQSYRAPCPT